MSKSLQIHPNSPILPKIPKSQKCKTPKSQISDFHFDTTILTYLVVYIGMYISTIVVVERRLPEMGI